jgi:hypothetical protein
MLLIGILLKNPKRIKILYQLYRLEQGPEFKLKGIVALHSC